MAQDEIDQVPKLDLGPPPQRKADFSIVGTKAVDLLDELVSHLKGVNDHKQAVLRMMGIFEAAMDKQILIQGEEGEPLVVQGLWK